VTNPGDVTSSRTLTDAECVERLFAATVGRVAFVTPGGLQVIPVNVRSTGTSLMLNTSPGSSLSQLAEMGREVTLEVDEALTGSGQAWSVLMHGPIVKLDAHGRQRREAMPQQVEAWPADATQPLEFTPRSYSGRLVQRAGTDQALLLD
jgi:nitroimidazol reductase NimA-like FMN-containing flavoprotein (pyridoxamine 5'-phosphate oxidase superfamily)